MKTYFLLLCLWICATGTFAQGSYRPDSRIPYRNVSGRLIVDVEVNGIVRPFLFDTGAARSCIQDTLARELQLNTRRDFRTSDSGGNQGALPLVRIDTLLLGDWQIYNLSTLVINSDDNPLLECFGIYGIIGSDLLQNRAVRISSRDSCLYMAGSAETWGLKRRDGIKTKLLGTRPFFKIRLSGEHTKASHWILIDTGATGYSCRLDGHMQHLERQGVLDTLKKGFGRTSYGIHGAEPVNEQWAATAHAVHLGNTTLEQVPMNSTHGGSSLLGTFLLQYGDMTIDYRNKRFYYEPFVETIRIGDRLPQRVSIANILGEVVVAAVWDEELAQKIRPGDRVVSLNGRPGEEFGLCYFLTGEGMLFQDGTAITIETQSGETIDITKE